MNRSVLVWLLAMAVLVMQPHPAAASIKWVEKPLYLFGADTNGNQKWDLADDGPTRNTSDGICAAVAIANSFAYLYQHYPEVYNGTGLIPLGGNGTLEVGDIDNLRNSLAGLIYYPTGGNAEAIWEAKNTWLTEHAPGTTTLDGQVYIPGVELGSWTNGSVLQNKYPDFDFLWTEIRECEDVELGLLPVVGDVGHSVTLTGVAWDDDCDGILEKGETPTSIRYLDPNGKYKEADGTPFGQEADLIWNDIDKRWEIEYWGDDARWYIYRAYSESPVPEPATIIVWSMLGAASWLGMGTWRRRRPVRPQRIA